MWIYDIETYRNFFLVGFINLDGDYKAFEISLYKDDREPLRNFLLSSNTLVGFNSISYDDQVMGFLWANYDLPVDELLRCLYRFSQYTIKYNYWKRKPILPFRSIDLFLIHHFNNEARRTSLKALQVALQHDRVQELPVRFDKEPTRKEMDEIIDYNYHGDLKATLKFYEVTIPMIEFRKTLSDELSIDLTNKPDASIGEMIVALRYNKSTGISLKHLKKQRTERSFIRLNECIPNNIRFQTDQLKNLRNRINNGVIEVKDKLDKLDYRITIGSTTYTVGLGGLHSIDEPGIILPNSNEKLMDADVSSMYPTIIIQYEYYPAHLGKSFLSVYSEILQERLEAKRNGDSLKNTSLKLALNAAYGKTKDKYSWLYDPKVTISTTITGQLSLLMLIETLELNGFSVVSANTDGIVTRVPEDKEEQYYYICKQWEKKTMMNLEFAEYQKIVIGHINSYVAQYKNGKIKTKGFFSERREWHQSHSNKIVSKALVDYFIHNVPIEKTIKSHKNIYDYCMSQKIGKSKKNGKQFDVIFVDQEGKHPTQRLNRFYAAKGKRSGRLMKTDGEREISLRSTSIRLFNDYTDNHNDIDYLYYIRECNKVINTIENKQLTLF